MKQFLRIALALLVLLPTAAAVHFYRQAQRPAAPPVAPPEERLWTCPMHPQYVSDRPGECPLCGMTLVPRQAAEPAASGPPGYAPITVDAQRQRLIGMREVLVRRAPLAGMLRTAGRVA